MVLYRTRIVCLSDQIHWPSPSKESLVPLWYVITSKAGKHCSCSFATRSSRFNKDWGSIGRLSEKMRALKVCGQDDQFHFHNDKSFTFPANQIIHLIWRFLSLRIMYEGLPKHPSLCLGENPTFYLRNFQILAFRADNVGQPKIDTDESFLFLLVIALSSLSIIS